MCRLLDGNMVFHLAHALYPGGDLTRAVLFGGRADEAAQLHGAAECIHVDLTRLDHVIRSECGFHLRGDGGVVDVFTRAFPVRRARTAGAEKNGARAKEQDETGADDSKVGFHDVIYCKVAHRSYRLTSRAATEGNVVRRMGIPPRGRGRKILLMGKRPDGSPHKITIFWTGTVSIPSLPLAL